MEQRQQHLMGDPTYNPQVSSGWKWAKLSLRLLSIICSIAVIGAAAYYSTQWTIGALIMMGPPTVAALLWDCVDSILICVRPGHDGVHPVACLIVDLLLFLGLGAMSSVIAFTVSKFSDSGYYFAWFQDEHGVEYLHIVIGFGIFATVIHLVIFIMACYRVKGHQARAPRVIYVQADPNGAHTTTVQPQYYMPAPSESDPPPLYSPRSQNAIRGGLQDEIHASEPTRAENVMLEKKN